ncbi:MAG: hypothetical protein ABIU85_03850, partial [Methylotenera sp.]
MKSTNKLMMALGFMMTTAVAIPSIAMAEVETYKIDNAHSFANWSIRHVASMSMKAPSSRRPTCSISIMV